MSSKIPSHPNAGASQLGDFGNQWLYLTDTSTNENKDKAPILKKLVLVTDQDFDSSSRTYEFEVFLTHGDTPCIITGTITLDTETLQNLEKRHPNINSYEKASIAALIALNDLQQDESFLQDLIANVFDFKKKKKLRYTPKASEFTITLDMTKSGCVARSDQLFGSEKTVTIPFERFSKIPEVAALHLRDVSKITGNADNLYQRTNALCSKLQNLSDYIASLVKKEKEARQKITKLTREIEALKQKKSKALGKEKTDIEAQIQQKKDAIDELKKEIKSYNKSVKTPPIDLPEKTEWYHTVTHAWKSFSHSGKSWERPTLQRTIKAKLKTMNEFKAGIVICYKKIQELELQKKVASEAEITQLVEQIEQRNAIILSYREEILEIEKLLVEQLFPASEQFPEEIPKLDNKPTTPLDRVIDPNNPYPLKGRASRQIK